MLLYVIFLQYISIVSANFDLYSNFMNGISISDGSQTVLHRSRRQVIKRQDFIETTPTCEQMAQTSYTPFVVLFLYKTSGRFLGMGSIIDKMTILTASRVVEGSLHKPHNMLVLAGRLSPWWGKNSQVQRAAEIFQNDVGLAIVVLKHEFVFNKNILPIKLPLVIIKDYAKEYDRHWAVFGIPRTSWDAPGEETSKTNIYLMAVESEPDKKDACKAAYPDLEFNETIMTCTYANGTFCWGCIGSPTVAINKANKVLQIAVLTRATTTEQDDYHIHVKLDYFEQWIRSHSLVGYKNSK